MPGLERSFACWTRRSASTERGKRKAARQLSTPSRARILRTPFTFHRAWLAESGHLDVRRRERAEGRVRDVVDRELTRSAWSSPRTRPLLVEGVEAIARGEATPYSVADRIVRSLLR